jgi:hypothetical protein
VAKTRTESMLRNLRIELVADDDDPSTFQVIASYDVLDEDGNLIEQVREDVAVEQGKHAAAVELITEVTNVVMAARGLTPADRVRGKERQEQARQEREAERVAERERYETELTEAAERLKAEHAPFRQAEIEAAKEKLLTEFPRAPLPELPPAPEEILTEILDQATAEEDRLRVEREQAGETYAQEQAEAAQNRQRVDDETMRRQREAEGLPVPPERVTRPQRR